MYTCYKMTNTNNGRPYFGRTENYEQQIENHKKFLQNKKHFNKLLQTSYDNNNLDLEFEIIEQSDDPKEIALLAIELITEAESHMASQGYNLYSDFTGNQSRYFQPELFNEDILFYYLLHNRHDTLKYFNITTNVLNFKLRANHLLKEKTKISSYQQGYCMAQYILMLSQQQLSSSQIFNKLDYNFEISNRIRLTPHKISKALSGYPNVHKEKKSGSLKFWINS